ncbi:MAG: RCC1 repeat-containing protein, partial [Rhodanobacteraceae bacterium]|nr:RCC1 repeat-containing protein [Rhodanobacteraceae bacterium]
SVMCWGYNGYGQLGDGSTTSSSAPLLVPNLSGIHEVAAGSGHTCARDGAGKVWCWGHNAYGQLGDGSYVSRNTAVATLGVGGVSALSTGAAAQHQCAIVAAGALKCWGDGYSGQLGNGQVGFSLTPVVVVGLGDVVFADGFD